MYDIHQADLNNAQHAAAVLALLQHYALDPMGGGEALADDVVQQLIPRLQQRQDALIVLAFDGPRGIGLVNSFEGFSTFKARPLLNIHDVVVHADYRGRGLSRRMLAHVEQLARQRGCCKLTLEVLQGNQVAQAAYRACGFGPYELDPAMGQALFWQKLL